MGEFERSNIAQGRSLLFALGDIFTPTNIVIAVISALIGTIVIQYLRNKL
jgi:hypothetical protein